jgi:hypothetical protein
VLPFELGDPAFDASAFLDQPRPGIHAPILGHRAPHMARVRGLSLPCPGQSEVHARST